MSARPVRTVTATPKDALDARLRSGSMVGGDGPASPSRTTWSPSKLKKAQAQEARLNPVLGGLPPNEVASGIIAEGMNSTIKHFRMINVKEHADAQLNVGGNLLYAHRCVINARCPALFTKFVKEKQIKKGVTYIKVDDKQIDDPTLYAVLHYLYSDELLFHTMESAQVVNLLRAAQQYELPRLAWMAERYLKSIVTLDNFFVLLKVAATGTVVRAKTLCMEFGVKHFKEIIVRKDGVTSLGLELFREFVEFVVIPPAEGKKVDVDPESKNLPSTIEEDFTKIYNDMTLTDGAALLSGDRQPVRFHCAFLLETAPSLSSAFTISKDTSEEHREQMTLELPKNAQLSAGAFRSLLRFVYYSDKSIEPLHAAELVPFARFYEIPALSEVVESIIKTGITVSSVITILSLCYNKDVAKVVKNDVHNPSLKYVLGHFSEIDFKPLKKKPAAISYDILRLCKKQIEEGKWKRADGSSGDDETTTGNESAREQVSESEDRKKRREKEKEPEDEVVTKDALAPMRDVARGSSPRLSSRKQEVQETESAPNSPAEEPRRRRKVGKTRSLIEPSVKSDSVPDMSLSYVPPTTTEEPPSPSKNQPKTTDDLVPPAPSKSSIEAVPSAEEKADSPKSAESAGEAAQKTEAVVAPEETKKPEEPKTEEVKVEEKKEEKAETQEKKSEEAAPSDKAPEEEKVSKKDRKKKEEAPAEETAAPAPAESEKSSRKSSRKEEKPEDKKDRSPSKESKDSDSDSSRAAIRDKIKAFESQAKAAEAEKATMVRVPSQKSVAASAVKPKK